MRDFSKAKRVVIKVGTNLLSAPEGINMDMVKDIVNQISIIKDSGHQVILVSSGAVGLGAKELKHNTPVVYISMKQACAAIGQPILMRAYEEEFKKHNLICAQVLITRSILNNRTSYKNLRSTVATLLALGVIPIFNENDVVSTAEIGNVFGDNDRMSALVASKIDADLLILLTDIDGLYTGNPKSDKGAVLIDEVREIDSTVISYARGKGSTFSTGGMKTKLLAAQIAQKGGCATIIASGFEKDTLLRVMKGDNVGTFILPDQRLSQRERWILNTPAEGRIIVDEGCRRALLLDHKSLLPSGIAKIIGVFEKGDVVEIAGIDGRVFMKACPYFNSTDLSQIMGRQRKDVELILGKGQKDIVFRPEDSVIL